MGDMRRIYKISVHEAEGKRPRGIPRRRWEGNISMDLKDTVKSCKMDASG
jgi:hypothetical protein